MFFSVATLLAVIIIRSQQVNGEENQWLVIAKKTQYSIKDSVAKVNSYEVSGDRIKLIADKAFDDFVMFVKTESAPIIFEKPSGISESNIRNHVKNWVEGLERTSINGATENSTSTAQDSLNKFESTIQRMVEKAPKFGEIVRTASPEDRGILTDIGTLVCKAMDKLAANMKVVESRLQKYAETKWKN